jgi:hypothetical protein
LKGRTLPKKLAILATMLSMILTPATPALAQDERMGEGQYGPESDTFTITHAPPEEISRNRCVGATSDPEASEYLQDGVAQEAKEAAMRAAEEAAGVQNCDQQVNQAKYAADTAARESMTEDAEGMSPAQKGAAAYLAALRAARGAGADDETARDIAANVAAELPDGATQDNAASESETSSEEEEDETAKEDAKEVAAEGVTSGSGTATGKASKANEDGSGEGSAAVEDKTHKERASKEAAAQSKHREDKKSHEDKTREDDTATDNASEEDVTEDADNEVAASGEDGGSGGEDVQTTPAGSRVPLLLGGVAFLALGGYAALLFVRSRTLVRGRRLVRY